MSLKPSSYLTLDHSHYVITEVDCVARLLRRGGCGDIDRALREALGFKIPIPKAVYVASYPDVFEYGEWEYSDSAALWLKHILVGPGAVAVMCLDYAWLGVLDGFLRGLGFCHDQTGPSSRPGLRTDLTVV